MRAESPTLVRAVVLLASILLAPVILSPHSASAQAAPVEASVTQGRMQVLLPSRPAAGYFTLENHGSMEMTLSGADAPDCKSLMLHQSKTEGGMASMVMVTSLPIPPHSSVHFAPGGYHLMCMQPSGALLTHKGIENVTLHFADGTSVSAPFAIQGVGPQRSGPEAAGH